MAGFEEIKRQIESGGKHFANVKTVRTSQMSRDEKGKYRAYKIFCSDHGESSDLVPVSYIWRGFEKELLRQPRCISCSPITEEEERKISFESDISRAEEVEKLKGICGIPERYSKIGFSDYLPVSAGAKMHRAFLEDYVKNFSTSPQSSVIFFGEGKGQGIGTGKTTLAACTGNALLEKCFSVKYVDASKLFNEVRESYTKAKLGNADCNFSSEIIHKFTSCDLLIIDEIGRSFKSAAEQNIIFEIINERYNNLLPVFLISNHNLQGICEIIGKAAYSRLSHDGYALKFDWEDYRCQRSSHVSAAYLSPYAKARSAHG